MSQKDPAVWKYGEVFQHVENILHSGLCTYKSSKGELRLSKGVYDLLGLEENHSPITEPSLLNFINPEDMISIQSVIKTIKTGGKFHPFEFSITDTKGLQKRLYAEGRLLKEEGDGMVYYCVLKDITESYYYKQALEQKITQLDKSNKNLQEFVYVASHDLQEPLRKIYTFTERLNTKFEEKLGQEGGMFLKRILSSTKNMQVLLEDLLSFSRLSFNEKQFESVSLRSAIDSVTGDLEMKIEETGTKIRIDNLPTIDAYPSQIKQLFTNLIGNAIKFRKEGEPAQISITCAAVTVLDYPDLPLSKNSVYIRLLVEDNGIGFDQEFSERIFKIFQRLNGKSEYAGSGVGLAICKKIVDNHHGFIFANGTPGKGAGFTVLLPQKQS